MNEFLIIRSPINSADFIHELVPSKSYLLFIENKALEKEIEQNKNTLVDILFHKIPSITNKSLSHKLIEQKRKIYNQISPFKIELFTENKNLFNDEELKFIINDYNVREKFVYNQNKIFENLIFEKEIFEKNVIELLNNNEWFKSAICVSNRSLFESIYQKKTIAIDKNKFTTLLRYIYKSSIMSTPSSLWSGVNLAEWDDLTHCIKRSKFLEFTFEYNLKKFKHRVRTHTKLNFVEYMNEFFYINPTLFEDSGYLYYWKAEYKSLKKCRLKNNDILSHILKVYNNKIFKLNVIKNELGNYISEEHHNDFIQQLINLDIVRIKADPIYGSSNPFQYTFQNEEENSILRTKYNIPDLNFREDFKKISYCNDNYDAISTRVNTLNAWETIKLSKEIKQDLKIAGNLYKAIFEEMYSESRTSEIQKEEFAKKYGYDNLIPILKYSFDREKLKNSANFEKNYRAWEIPKAQAGISFYKRLIEYIIKNKVLLSGNKEVIINSSEILKLKPNSKIKKNKVELEEENEIIFQFFKESDTYFFIPEMYSTMYGRLAGRFIKLFDKRSQEVMFKQLIEHIDNKEKLVQTNIHINNDLDGLGFDNPFIEEKLLLYDYNAHSSEKVIFINEVFIKLNKSNDKFSIHLCDGTPINLWNSSSISPGNDILYNLLNYIPHQEKPTLNGHAKSRIELDLDYQPRIIIDKLIFSRERFRLKKEYFEFLNKSYSDYQKMEFLFSLVYDHQLPLECFLYTDTNFKPQYIQFKSVYDLNIIQRIIRNSLKYIYIEECLPSKEQYWLNDGNEKYNAEVWSKI
ncbi:hypothetical protein ACE3MZ_12925 [Paenibacillus sp. WLX1005]|uniref:hypothetical protein n=1 Tax=Paenibacillus sp. WLX1005 TaxID=3243766 RepID=UPI003984044A